MPIMIFWNSIPLVLLFLLQSGFVAAELPAKLPPAVIHEQSDGACPSDEGLMTQKETVKELIQDTIRDVVVPELQCPCGGFGPWTKIADLNFSDPNVACPSNLNLITTPRRGCGRSTAAGGTCDSTIFSSNGLTYSRVCGRIIAYQKGSTDAFDPSVRGYFAGTGPNPGLDSAYVDGISLTHGAAGSRQHIWTFAAALYEIHIDSRPYYICSCTDNNPWPYELPSFIGNDYFCDTGNPGPGWTGATVYQDNPLWDGEGCGPANTCCELNNPPWFCTTLPQPSTDDIEMRMCHDQHLNDEDIVISLVDIYIK